jgi:indole-3-acetate monooxygenase
LRSARNFVESNAQQVWQTVASSGELAFPQRIDIRMAATFALQEAKLVADVTWEIAGVNAIFSSGLFERRLETSARSCSFAQGRKAHAYLLGLEPSLAFA